MSDNTQNKGRSIRRNYQEETIRKKYMKKQSGRNNQEETSAGTIMKELSGRSI